MSLFQIQVERQYLSGITTDLHPIYQKYLDYFGNAAIQANILELIEQQYQGEFIEALFVNILGYTAQPQPNFNLLREKKNETDAKSADAAISVNNKIVAVIELKDHKTQDLKKIEPQAFGYKNNHKNCHYVVTSNFERLRFYIDNAVEFIEFNLFNLTFDEFRRLWLCLSYESIAKNLPQEIKNQSISSEDIITKQLYKDYSAFKRQLFDSILVLNPDYDKLLLFKKTQKLLDRFLFLLFAEDKQLLPANSVKGTVEKWKKFNADPMNDYQSLYSRFVKYFKLLNEGYKDANIEIYAYNGGLFANDELLNSIRVEDEILCENVLKIATYNFDTAVDVNILGHIFENSLNEIEQVANEISTGEKTTSKRKQDGVFYTPRYITQYIVENTVGRLCDEKKTELGITMGHAPLQKKEKQALYNKFTTYREWLLQITVVDPACGSGAFLNTALDFLITEHKWIDNQQDKIAGLNNHYSMGLSNIENTILENNLFGVDINDESVEIAKLSLWLRTAKPHRKLSSLNNNIKCGNSLINDPAVAGDKAFDWHTEFPQIFKLKEKKAWHITTATHNSRYSQRMYDNFVKLGEPVWLTEKEELIITRTVAEIAEKDQLNILAYNICGDHMHIALVCEEDEVEKIVGKLKSMSARAANIAMGRTISQYAGSSSRGHAPIEEEDILLPVLLSSSVSSSSSIRERSIEEDSKGKRSIGERSIGERSIGEDSKNERLTRGHAPLSGEGEEEENTPSERGETQTKLWTQKFYHREIKSEEELHIKLNYIRTNREKHGLPDINKQLLPLVDKMVCTIQHAYSTEYKGGFDVVIGNPPYVRPREIEEERIFLCNNYKAASNQVDLYHLFIEKINTILKRNGLASFITPNAFLSNETSKELRLFIIENFGIELIVECKQKVFSDANVEATIFCFNKNKNNETGNYIELINNQFTLKHDFKYKEFLLNKNYIFSVNIGIDQIEIYKKIKYKSNLLSDYFQVMGGIKEYQIGKGKPSQTKEMKEGNIFNSKVKLDETYIPEIRGRHLIRYGINWEKDYISYGSWLAEPRDIKYFQGEKILIRQIPGKTNLICGYTTDDFIIDQSAYSLKQFIDGELSYKYVLALVNSKLIFWFFRNENNEFDDLFPKIKSGEIKSLPIKSSTKLDQQPFILKADAMLAFNKELQLQLGKFQRILQRKFELEEIPGKLQNWHLLSFKEFIAELGKKKVKLTLADESQWEEYFLAEQTKALEIKKQIDDTDHEIDRMVYALYELTEEEIMIVEGKA